MRAWRDLQGQERVWHTRDAILLCVGHGRDRAALVFGQSVQLRRFDIHRMPDAAKFGRQARGRLAQELGAETATLSDPQEDKAILRYAREHNLGKITITRSRSGARRASLSAKDSRLNQRRCWRRPMTILS
jgi:two-component system sensor histidine kinase KdpD